MSRERYWPEPDPDVRKEHRARWQVYVTALDGLGRERIAHSSTMTDGGFSAWDATCACGYDTSTNGAPKATVRDLLAKHRSEVQFRKLADAEGGSPGERVVLGEGILTWPMYERVSSRFGTVLIAWDGVPLTAANVREDCYGILLAEVTEARHQLTGDGPPGELLTAGTVLTLGAGYLFTSRAPGYPVIGLRPDLGLEKDDERAGEGWMDASQLALAQYQLVRLTFTPVPAPGAS